VCVHIYIYNERERWKCCVNKDDSENRLILSGGGCQVFERLEPSVKCAKYAAAEAALHSFADFKNAPEVQQTMHMRITSDVRKTLGDTEPYLHLGEKNPIMFLYKQWPGMKFVCVSENGEPDDRFTVSVTINNQTFLETGSGSFGD
jgi:hypothetical protein